MRPGIDCGRDAGRRSIADSTACASAGLTFMLMRRSAGGESFCARRATSCVVPPSNGGMPASMW